MNYLRIILTAVLPVVCFLYKIYFLSAKGSAAALSFPHPSPEKTSSETKEYLYFIFLELTDLGRYGNREPTTEDKLIKLLGKVSKVFRTILQESRVDVPPYFCIITKSISTNSDFCSN